MVIEPLPELSDAELDAMFGIEPPAPVKRRPSSSSSSILEVKEVGFFAQKVTITSTRCFEMPTSRPSGK